MSCVYGLISSKEPSRVRYIGISKYENADNRLVAHMSASNLNSKPMVYSLPLYKWIRKHVRDGYEISYVILETGLSWEEACFLEIEHIKSYKKIEPELLNMTDGGEGFLGSRHTEESKEKIRAYWTEEKREAQRERTKERGPHVFSENEKKLMSELAKNKHSERRNAGLKWGVDLGPKDKIPKAVKEFIVSERSQGKSFWKIAKQLNDNETPTANGGKWYAMTVKNIFDRYFV
jgi:hypothetical protein